MVGRVGLRFGGGEAGEGIEYSSFLGFKLLLFFLFIWVYITVY